MASGTLVNWIKLAACGVALAGLTLAVGAADDSKVPLKLTLPAPAFAGTPKEMPLSSYVEPLSKTPRPPMMVPAGLKNIAPEAKLSASDKNATPDVLAKLTDGNKEANDDSVFMLRKGTQYVQMEFAEPREIFALVIWHSHSVAKVYQDVIVQTADDADFTSNVQTIFNNDQDNSSGLGAGKNMEYFETYEGKLIDTKGLKTRFLRFYSKGSTESKLNEYTEIEIYGRPAK